MDNAKLSRSGFTLIEISIVLIIIGLIVGGILTGRDLIDTAAQRAQIAQIEKYNTAVNTFRGKYGYLPGDIPDPYASNFGFQARGQYAGEGDGNGILEGITANAANSNSGVAAAGGETAVFWVDLSTAGLIPDGLTAATETSLDPSYQVVAPYFPVAKIGGGNFVYVSSFYGINYYGISIVTNFNNPGPAMIASNVGMSVQQAYAIDSKIDDGLPQSGRVAAWYVNNWLGNGSHIWSNGVSGRNSGSVGSAPTPFTSTTPAASYTCFDNGGVNGTTQHYSMGFQNGANINCGLMFNVQW